MQEKIALGPIEIYAPRQIVLEALQYVPGGSALDLGSGFGRHSLLLASKGFEVTAVDSNPERLQSLREKATRLGVEIRTEAADVHDFDAHGKQYNLVLSTMVLHFLSSRKEMAATVKKMQEATHSGGVNVVCSYTDKSQHDLRPYLLNVKELQKLYSQWEVLQFEEFQGTDADIDGPDKGKMIWRVEMIARKK